MLQVLSSHLNRKLEQFEREWSNKDIGVRTFAMMALLDLLDTLLGPSLLLSSGSAVLIVIVFTNLRGLQTARKLEATTHLERGE